MLLNATNLVHHYDLLGSGSSEVVVLCHSLAGDLGMWAEQVPALLKAGFRVLRYDLRGHGGSTVFSDQCSIDELGRDLIEIVNQLNIEKFHFVGLSIGGAIGQSIALSQSARLKSLFLCDTQSESFADARKHWSARIEKIKSTGTVETIADETMQRWLTAEYKNLHGQRWKQIRDTVACCSVTGYVCCANALADFKFTDRLKEIEIRTLIGCGSDDPRATPAESQRIACLFPNAKYVEFNGAKHVPNVEQSEKFNAVLVNWLLQSREFQ